MANVYFANLVRMSCTASFVAVGTTSCSVYMASTQPEAKDVSTLSSGLPMAVVDREFGEPSRTEVENGRAIHYHTFVQGYTRETLAARATGHAVLDTFSLGAWELIGVPIEYYFDGEEREIRVTYSPEGVIETVEEVARVQEGESP